MSQIMKSFLGLFLLLFLMASCASILTGFLSVLEAQDLHATMIDELEDSHFYPEITVSLINDAIALGYEPKITLYYADKTSVACQKPSDVPQDGQVDYAEVVLDFPLEMGFFGLKDWHSLTGFAR